MTPIVAVRSLGLPAAKVAAGSPEPEPRTIRFLQGSALYAEYSAAITSKKPNELTSGPPGAENLSTITADCVALFGT